MGKKTMNTHVCMFTGSELCLCGISRYLCCMIRKNFLRQNILLTGPVSCWISCYLLLWVESVVEKEVSMALWHMFCHY